MNDRDYRDKIRKRLKSRAQEAFNGASYAVGYQDGKKFVPTKRIKER